MSLPPSQFGGDDGDGGGTNYDSIYDEHNVMWDMIAEEHGIEGGYILFNDVIDALEAKQYGAGTGWDLGSWLNNISDIFNVEYDDEGNLHFDFDFDYDGAYGGSRSV